MYNMIITNYDVYYINSILCVSNIIIVIIIIINNNSFNNSYAIF